MKKIIYTALIAIGLFALQNAEAQSISRSTLCASGATHSNSSGSLTATFGQCPGCGTLSSSSGFLTVGFQQPNGDTCFTASFDFVETSDACGTSFDFTYTGNANIGMVSFEWDFGPEGFPQSSTLANPQGVSFASTGTKTVSLKVSDGACVKLASFDLNVPATGFATNPVITSVNCLGGEDGAIEIEVNGGTPPFNYEWSTGELSESLSGLPAGEYAYSVTDATGCKSVNTATLISLSDSIVVDVVSANETCEGDADGSIQVTVTGGTPPLDLQWSSGESTPVLNDLRSDEYTLTVTDNNGCVLETIVMVGQMCNPEIVDILTPNGDGINDIWVIEGIESFPDNEVGIFNRWGQRVWNKDGYTNDWAGTNNDGELLPVGAYFYVVMLNNDSKDVLSGSITIVR